MNALSPPRLFLASLVLSVFVRLALAIAWPPTGDELYFVEWARHPDYGYYDHPPLYGWLLIPFYWVSDALWWLRLPLIISTSLVAILMYRFLRPHGEMAASLVASLYMLAPITLFAFQLTTDVPLILFSFLAALAFYRAVESKRFAWYLLAGLLWGLAFLSKYFALFLGAAFVAVVIMNVATGKQRGWHPWLGLVALGIAAMPAVLVNLAWNANHCWDNILFNFVNRTSDAHFSLENVALMTMLILFIVTPFIGWHLYRERARMKALIREPMGFFLIVFIVPVVILLVLSFKKKVMLHWVLSFYPFFFVMLGVVLPRARLVSSLKWMASLSALILAIMLTVLALPVETFKASGRHYTSLVFDTYANMLLAKAAPLVKGRVLASNNYSWSGTLSYYGRSHAVVIGVGAPYGRQDDILQDYRKLADKDIVIILGASPDLAHYVPYFNRVSVRTVELYGARFYLVLGNGFRYAPYRDRVLMQIDKRYYRIPSVLPVRKCYFKERYTDTRDVKGDR